MKEYRKTVYKNDRADNEEDFIEEHHISKIDFIKKQIDDLKDAYTVKELKEYLIKKDMAERTIWDKEELYVNPMPSIFELKEQISDLNYENGLIVKNLELLTKRIEILENSLKSWREKRLNASFLNKECPNCKYPNNEFLEMKKELQKPKMTQKEFKLFDDILHKKTEEYLYESNAAQQYHQENVLKIHQEYEFFERNQRNLLENLKEFMQVAGYKAIPYDYPHQYKIGYSFRKDEILDSKDDNFETIEIIIPLLKKIAPTKTKLYKNEWQEFVEQYQKCKFELMFKKYSNPKTLEMGFQYYDHKENQICIHKIRLPELKTGMTLCSKSLFDELKEFFSNS